MGRRTLECVLVFDLKGGRYQYSICDEEEEEDEEKEEVGCVRGAVGCGSGMGGGVSLHNDID